MTEFLASIDYPAWALHALVLLPLAGALLLLLLPERFTRPVALGVTLVEALVALGLWWAYDPGQGMQLRSAVTWIGEPYNIRYAVGIDGLSVFLVMLSALLMPLCVWSSWHYIETRLRGYYALLLVLLTGMIGVFITLDLFVFYVFWEVMLIPMYFLIGVWGGKNRLYAAIKFFIYTFLGSLLMLVAILVIVWHRARSTGVIGFGYEELLAYAATGALGPLKPWLFLAFALAFAIKVPVFPFHTWLPDAHVEAPTAASVLLASVLLKMGTYGFLRFAIPFFPAEAFAPLTSAVVVVLAVTGIIYGALVALVQPDVKKLVAYSSVSHMGFAMLGIWAMTVQGVQGAIVVMLAHGISTGGLFFLIGMLYERRHTREISAFGGIARVRPAFATILVITAFSSIGVPGTNGFVGEFLVLIGSFGPHPVATAFAATGVIFSAAYLLWAVQRVVFNKLDKPENEALTDLSPREWAVLLPLVLGILWLGLYPQAVLRRTEPAARAIVEQVEVVMPRTA
ncbi:MAG TPA: NADH-quinone oxidoreductase subunit M, partial [Gemmatimonadales bacterium]|nr:NADH-quinone oxidoreductase subunit M [Gemmatimonadales bacterium]